MRDKKISTKQIYNNIKELVAKYNYELITNAKLSDDDILKLREKIRAILEVWGNILKEDLNKEVLEEYFNKGGIFSGTE